MQQPPAMLRAVSKEGDAGAAGCTPELSGRGQEDDQVLMGVFQSTEQRQETSASVPPATPGMEVGEINSLQDRIPHSQQAGSFNF